MTTSTPTRARRIAYGAIGVGAASFAFAPAAGASPLTDAAQGFVPNGVIDAANDVAKDLPPLPAPVKTLDNFMSQAQGIVPQNLLRTNSGSHDATEVADTTAVNDAVNEFMGTKEHVTAPTPGVAPETARNAYTNYTTKASQAPLQTVAQNLLDTFNGHNDPNNIGQAFGAFQIPNEATRAAIVEDVNHLVNNVTSGRAVADLRQVINDTRASEEFAAWRHNTRSIFNVDESLPADQRASAGVANLIDSISANPARGLSEVLAAGGGPLAFITNPAQALTRVAHQVFGPAIGEAVDDFLNTARANLGQSLFEAAPALLLGPIISSIGGALGAPLGALTGAGIGATLGALAPHNLLVGLLSAIPGAILGGLATGAVGLVGSLLASLPLFGILPLAGAATGSALALAALATTVFGIYLLSFIPVTIFALVTAAVIGVATFGFLMLLSAGNPIRTPASIGAGILAAILTTVIVIGGYALLSAAVPLIIFGVLAPLFVGGGLLMGMLAGLGTAALVASILIPLATVLSAIPGAIAGGLFGFLAGTAISSWISAIVGAIAGGIIGGIIGNLIGRAIGAAIGFPLAFGLFALIAGLNFGTFLEEQWNDPNGPFARMRDAIDRGWRESLLGRLIGSIQDRFNGTDTGSTLGNLLRRVNALFATITFLDGRRLREMLLRGSILGAIIGAPVGGVLGGIGGFLAGLFNPMNLLNGLAGFIAGAIPGALGGAALGSLLSDLLIPLVGIPVGLLSFLPWLGVLFTLWAIPAALTTLAALASTLVPALAAATVVTLIAGIIGTAPLWIPFTIVSTVLTIFQAIAWNPSTGGVLIPTAAAVAPIILTAVVAQFIIIGGGVLLSAVFLGIPTFLIVAALFTFPALAVPLAWLLALPLLLPLAAGLSTLTGLGAGLTADLLSKLLTVPLGALIGGLVKGGLSGLTALVLSTIVRTAVYTTAGAGLGTIAGATFGAIAGAIAAFVTHLRGGAGVTDGAVWGDARIVNRGGFGDVVGNFIPAFNGQPKETRVAVPQAAAPRLTAGAPKLTRDRSLTDATALVGA